MTLDQLGNLGEFIGAVGVIFSVLYLAVQIRHGAAEVRANTSQIILSASIENRSDMLHIGFESESGHLGTNDCKWPLFASRASFANGCFLEA